jgi:hypothetical protein
VALAVGAALLAGPEADGEVVVEPQATSEAARTAATAMAPKVRQVDVGPARPAWRA